MDSGDVFKMNRNLRTTGTAGFGRRIAGVCLVLFAAVSCARGADSAPADTVTAPSETVEVPLPETPEALFGYAQQMENEGKMVAACDAYTLFLARFPDHSQIQETGYRLGKCLDVVGRVDEAVVQLEAVMRAKNKRFRNRQDAIFLLGKLYGELNDYEKACRAFETLLAEGAGLFEEDALNLCAAYYAVQKKYQEAAGKLNILKRRENAVYAERAAYKLVLVWLEAGNLDLAVESVSYLAKEFPQNLDARGLMLRIADVFRQQRKFMQAIAICNQLQGAFPKSREALASGYVVGMCYRDQKQPDKAIEVLVATARIPENAKSGVAAESMVKAADILLADKADIEQAMERYEEATDLARFLTDEERRQQVLEVCYFRLAEYAFQNKKWAVALEFYTLLRKNGTTLNVLPRMMKCQAELGMDPDAYARGESELAFIRKKIAENPGTYAAAEGEVFLADHDLTAALAQGRSSASLQRCAAAYADILKRYPPAILAEFHLHSYILVQLGRSQAALYALLRQDNVADTSWEGTIRSFERAITIDAETPYARDALEFIAQTADNAGQKEKAFETYTKLFELTGEKLKTAKDDAQLQDDRMGYLKALLTRARQTETIEDAIALSNRIIEQDGVGSPTGRHALLYTGELYYLRKDFSAAAKAFNTFIDTYGPKRNEQGDFADGPLKVGTPDETTEQLFEAALRVAQAWYLQGHHQNMIKAYGWMARNMPNKNPFSAEAHYWLAMELAQGEQGKTPENRRKLADQLWTNVVCTVSIREFPGHARAVEQKLYRPGVTAPSMMKYAKLAIVKTGEILSELGDHETAARMFEAYLALYPAETRTREGEPALKDELHGIARYALGREYIVVRDYAKMIAAYKPYLDGLRDDRFRITALRFMGFYGTTDELKAVGVEAYATLLDEYGKNPVTEKGERIPIPQGERIRLGNSSWNGIRLPPPDDFDFGQIRYALGFLYWKNDDMPGCIRALTSFMTERDLKKSDSRAQALYMLGKSHFKLRDIPNGAKVLAALLSDHPTFAGIEEVFVQAAWGAMMMKDWKKILDMHANFCWKYKTSLLQPHMDLYQAVAYLNIPEKQKEGLEKLASLGKSETYQDVKADALYYQAMHLLAHVERGTDGKLLQRDLRAIHKLFAASVEFFPRAPSCLEAAKCAILLGRWSEAKGHLDKVLRNFPDAEIETVRTAKQLMPQVQLEIAKAQAEEGGSE